MKVQTFRAPDKLIEAVTEVIGADKSDAIRKALEHAISCPNAKELSNMVEGEDLFTVKDLTTILGVPQQTISDWCHQGLKRVYINNHNYLISIQDLIDFMSKNGINSIKFTQLTGNVGIELSDFGAPLKLVQKYGWKFDELTLDNLHYWLREKKIKFVKPNQRHYLVHEKSLLDFLEERNKPKVHRLN